MKIAVFGDSYAESGASRQQTTWVDMLAAEHDVTMYSQPGCGQDYQFSQLLEYFEADRSDSVVVFALPHPLRISLVGVERHHEVYSFLYLHNRLKGVGQRIASRLKSLTKSKNINYEAYKSKYGPFLDLWYEQFLLANTYIDTESFKTASAISKYRRLCKKIILLPIHPFSDAERQLLQEDNFIVSGLTLRLLDEQDSDPVIINGIDTRAGHMNYDNHCVVYEYIKDQLND